MSHGQHDGLHQLLDLLLKSSNIAVVLRWLLVNLHRLHTRIILGRQRVQDEVGVLVDAHQVARLEFVRVNQTDDGQEDGLPRGRLQHHSLAAALRVQVHVAAVLLLLRLAGGRVSSGH